MFTLITIITLALLQFTDWGVTGSEFATGLQFSLPPVDSSSLINPMTTALAAFGIIGMGSGELLMYPYWCLEKGYAKYAGVRDGTKAWTERARGWFRVLKIDAWASMGVYTFTTVVFYLLGAAVLWRVGLNPARGDMIRTLSEMYVPVFGSWAQGVFLFGAFAVSILNVLCCSRWLQPHGSRRVWVVWISRWESEASRLKWTRVISMIWPLMALATYVVVKAPVAMVLASGVAQAVMLPMLGVAVLYFRYKRSDPELLTGRAWDVFLWISSIGLFIAGCWSLYSTLS